MEDLDSLGICVKNQNKKVISQNEICKSCCGDRINQICDMGCMKEYDLNKPKSFSDGMTLLKNIENNLGLSDTVIINDGNTITTIIYQKSFIKDKIKYDLEELKTYSLTKSELNIIEHILSGKTNTEICKLLFISRPTLKSHINSIYKKVPEKWQILKQRNNFNLNDKATKSN